MHRKKIFDPLEHKTIETYGDVPQVVIMVNLVRESLGDKDFSIFINKAPQGAIALLEAIHNRRLATDAPQEYSIINFAQQIVAEAKFREQGNIPLEDIYHMVG